MLLQTLLYVKLTAGGSVYSDVSISYTDWYKKKQTAYSVHKVQSLTVRFFWFNVVPFANVCLIILDDSDVTWSRSQTISAGIKTTTLPSASQLQSTLIHSRALKFEIVTYSSSLIRSQVSETNSSVWLYLDLYFMLVKSIAGSRFTDYMWRLKTCILTQELYGLNRSSSPSVSWTAVSMNIQTT